MKERELYQAIEDFKLSIDQEIKRRARSNNDLILERNKLT